MGCTLLVGCAGHVLGAMLTLGLGAAAEEAASSEATVPISPLNWDKALVSCESLFWRGPVGPSPLLTPPPPSLLLSNDELISDCCVFS